MRSCSTTSATFHDESALFFGARVPYLTAVRACTAIWVIDQFSHRDAFANTTAGCSFRAVLTSPRTNREAYSARNILPPLAHDKRRIAARS